MQALARKSQAVHITTTVVSGPETWHGVCMCMQSPTHGKMLADPMEGMLPCADA